MSARWVIRCTRLLLVVALVASACTSSDEATTTTATAADTTTSRPVGPGTADLPVLPAPSMVVSAHRLGAEPYAGDDDLVIASALSEAPVERFDLWVDDQLAVSVEPATPGTDVAAELAWTAAEPGLHALLVRATDVDGTTAQASPLWVRVLDPGTVPAAEAAFRPAPLFAAGPALLDRPDCATEITVPAAPASVSIALLAAPFGSSDFSVVAGFLAGGGKATLPSPATPTVVYTAAIGPTGPAVPSAPAIVQPAPCAQGTWTGQLQFDGASVLAPGVSRAYLYASTDGTVWDRVPPARAFVYPDAAGRFDFSDWLPPLTPGSSLQAEAWGWRNGALEGLGTAVYSLPPAPGGSAAPSGLAQSIGFPQLPTQGSLDWALTETGGGQVLRRDGLLCTYDPVPPPGGGIGVLEDICDNGPFGVLPSVTFRWSPAPKAGLTHGVWQVSALPPPSTPLLTFPGLLATGPTPATTGQTVLFDVEDLPAIVAATAGSPTPASTVGANSLTYAQVKAFGAAAGAANGGAGTSTASGTQSVVFSVPAFLGGAAADPSYRKAPGGTDLPWKLYVRVIPMTGDVPANGVSNAVAFTLKHEAPVPVPPPGPDFEVTAQLTPPRLPNDAYSHCVRVVENPYGNQNPVPKGQEYSPLKGFYAIFQEKAFSYENGQVVHKGLVPGATVCALEPVPPDDSIWDVIVSAVEAVSWAWDLVSDAYGALKDTIVKGIVAASGCEAVMPKSTCTSIADAVVSIAATSVGLPPSLPTFSEFIDAAKGDLAALAVSAAAQAGFNCSVAQSVCEDLAEEMTKDFLDQIQKQATQAALGQAKSGGYTLFVNPNITVVPEPAGTFSPAVFAITVKRIAASPKATCTFGADVRGVTTWSWGDESGTWHQDEQVVGYPMGYRKKTVDVSDLSVGQSRQIVIAIDEVAPWYLPGQSNLKYAIDKYQPKSWIFFLAPAVMTMTAGSECGSVSQDWPQDMLPTEPWEIP